MTPHSLLPTTLLLGAALTALLAATPSEAGTALLPEGSRPPVFALPDGAGKLVSLRAFLGPRRIVLLFGSSAAFLRTVQSERAQFEDRDLSVLAITPSEAAPADLATADGVHVLHDAGERVAREYGAAGGTAFYLIGKDGHIAVARRGYPTATELFGIIDAMPMRRREMRERHG